jgi:hypothetical protein
VFVVSGYVGSGREFWWDRLERAGRGDTLVRMKAASLEERERVLEELPDDGPPARADDPGTWELLRRVRADPPDVIHAHNLRGGYFDLRALPELSRVAPLVLTMHDMWLITSHVAHSFECERWRTGCGECPISAPTSHSRATEYKWTPPSGGPTLPPRPARRSASGFGLCLRGRRHMCVDGA